MHPPLLAFLRLLPPTTSGFIHAEHQLALPLSLAPSLPLFLSFRFFIHIQRKNLSPIISSVGANLVWWQWTGNHKTFLIQTALSHQRSRLLTAARAKHTLHLWPGFGRTTSPLVPKQLNVYLFQIDSVREKCSVRISTPFLYMCYFKSILHHGGIEFPLPSPWTAGQQSTQHPSPHP